MCLGARRAAGALLLTEPRGERASAALPHRRRNGALNAPCLKRDRRPRRAPKGRPRWPEGEPHPNPAPKGREGCIKARPFRQSGIFWFGLEIRRSCSRRRRERWGPLVWKEASCSGIRPWGFAVRAGRRMAGACDCDARRQASFSVSGLARSGRPMPIPASCFRVDCRCRSSRRFRSRGCRLFRFRSAARHLWADRVPALTTAGERERGSSGGSVSSGGSGDAYNMMMSQDWGSEAEAAASAMGVSATALAATCAMESNCQNVGAASQR